MLSSRTDGYFTVVFLILAIFAGSLFADRTRGGVLFLLIGPGARATGMGEAFVAVADDPTATYWNPAGLGRYPLSSQWIDVGMPPGENVIATAAVKTGFINIDYTSYDIWAATDSGLYMLDGKKWVSGETYTTAEEETMSEVIFHFLDTWINLNAKVRADLEGGIKYDMADFNWGSYDSVLIFEHVIPTVLEANGLEELPTGYLKPETKILLPFEAFFDGKVTALHGGKKELWVGTDRGLFVRRKSQWERETTSSSPMGKNITVIGTDERGYLYVGTERGLYANKGARWILYTTADGLPNNHVHSLFLGSHREIWVGTEQGPARMMGEKFERNYSVQAEAVDTWKDFVAGYFPIVEPNRLDVVTSEIIACNDAIGTDRPTAGDRIDIPYSVIFESPATAIFVDEYNVVWFGTKLGLKAFDGENWKLYGWGTTTVEEETSIKRWAKSQWPGKSPELIEKLEHDLRHYNRFNPHEFKQGEIIAYPKNPISGHILSIERAPDGNVLLGTEYGTLSFDRKNAHFRYYMYGGLKNEKLDQIIRHGDEYWFNTGRDIKVYSEGKSGISFMHVNWLPVLAPDLYYEFLAGTTYLEGWGTVGGAITYINEGLNEWTDEAGNKLGEFTSYELAISACYGTRLTENLTAGLTFKLIHSALAPGVTVGLEQEEGKATTFAVDCGVQYDTPLRGLTLGASVQNLGPDIHYIDAAQADPLPRNMKLGLAYKVLNMEYNRLTLAADINKDLIDVGNDPFGKEFREAVKNVGFEYSYANFISLRGGYMIDYDYIPVSGADVANKDYDSSDWKGIHYFTVGAGINFKNFSFDFGYIPLQEDEDEGKLVLSNILRYSVSVMF